MNILFRILLIFFVPIYLKKDYTENEKIKHLIGNKIDEGEDKKCYEYNPDSNKVIKIAKEPYEMKYINYNIRFGNYRVYPLITILIFNFFLKIREKTFERIQNLNDDDNFAKIYDFNNFYYIQEKMKKYGKIDDKRLNTLKKDLQIKNLYISDLHNGNIMKNNGNAKIIDCEIYNSLEENIRNIIFDYLI